MLLQLFHDSLYLIANPLVVSLPRLVETSLWYALRVAEAGNGLNHLNCLPHQTH